MRSKAALVRILVAGSLLAAGATALDASAATVVAHGSVEQVYATGLPSKAAVTLLDGKNRKVAAKRATAEGGVLFYKVRPGSGYKVRVGSATSSPVVVRTGSAKPWDATYQKQTVPMKGYGYLTTRDGTKLAYTVHPPTRPAGLGTPDVTLPEGPPVFAPPYPTLIEYSGYGYANPDGPQSGIAVLANAMGFAVVDINMRGTGCSGGAFNFFERLQSLDGYDIVETIARQPWVKGNKVGMMGISYGGISQLFTAATQPPSLAAISPLSVLDTTPTTLYPGGVLNTGFAVAWAKERQHEAQPAGPGKGQAWAWDRIQAGDTTCKANQALHGEAQDLMATIRQNTTYDNKAYIDSIDPVTFVKDIKVPTFMACQWQDEQTGGHCPNLVRQFTGTKKKWFTFTNGPHIDSLMPETFVRWFDFLKLYVDKQAPITTAAAITAAAPVIYQEAMGLPDDALVTLPPDPIWAEPTYEGALAAFEALPPVRVLFENGAGSGPLMQASAGDPYSSFEATFSTLPVPGTKTRALYLGPKGGLSTTKPRTRGIDGFTADPKALPLTNFTGGTGGGGLWGNASQWAWNWKQNPAGTAVSYVSAPLPVTNTVVGAGSLTAWVRSSAPDVDLQVTVSDIDPSGNETFVQNGYLRTSYRALAKGSDNMLRHPSTQLEPVLSFLKRDIRPMPRDQFTKVVVPLYYSGHAYRPGHRIKVTVAGVNGAQPVWSFSETKPVLGRTAQVAVQFSPTMPSVLALPLVPGVDVPVPGPSDCPTLRNQPCRKFVAQPNRSLTR